MSMWDERRRNDFDSYYGSGLGTPLGTDIGLGGSRSRPLGKGAIACLGVALASLDLLQPSYQCLNRTKAFTQALRHPKRVAI